MKQCKRRNREDKVKLRKVIEGLEESVKFWEDSSEYWFNAAYPEED